MTATSTALLVVSPQGGGPFNGPVWRIGVSAQLVEKSSGPYWLIRDPDSLAERYVPVPALDALTLAQSILLCLVVSILDAEKLWLFEENHNLLRSESGVSTAEYWDLSDREIEFAVEQLRSRVKLGLTILDEETALTPPVVNTLTGWGIPVEVFVRV